MGMFIEVRVDHVKCSRKESCSACVEVCPVDIFRSEEGQIAVDSSREDECILCDLCLSRCPDGAITLNKLYGG